MSISVNPILPVVATQGAVVATQGVAPELVLQPGTVVDARVIKLLSDNLVRIAIASLSIDVLSEVPLSAGQTLQLAVSEMDGGIRLAMVGQGGAAGTPSDTVTLAPDALIDAAAKPSAAAAANQLTPLERQAVSAAVQTAASQQGSLSHLFANLGAVAGSGGLPLKLQQAVMQVLAQQTSLDQNLTGNDVKNAFQKSGLFLEASLASGSVSSAAGMPDLKAALIVLRQTLVSTFGTADAAQSSAALASSPHVAAASTLVPSLSADADLQDVLLPQARVAGAVDALAANNAGRIVLSAAALDAKFAAGAGFSLLQEALQAIPRQNGNALLSAGAVKDPRNDDVTLHTNTPPPFRGAQPSAQPVAAPSIAANAPLAATAHHLLVDTDAAIARQTLLQVASLPDRVDTAGPRLDPAAPRWNFEIPFATPQGTAMAQFEISRDGGNGIEAEAAKRVWRARFSLDVEPAGPVHALVTLSGERTSVRMWAERPATAVQLRAGAAQLSQALSKAELQPGDIVIRDGTPPASTPAPAGHFLDRAL
jgi:flagellar hook-length control protein FliK